MFEQDTRAREAHEREEEQLAFMKRALENPQPIATLYDLDKARMASAGTGTLAKRARAAEDGEEAEYYADGTLKRVRRGSIEKTYYANGSLKRLRLLDESELADTLRK